MRKSGEDKVAICKEPFWSASTAVLEGQSPTIRTAKLRHQNPARDTALQPDAPARVQLGSMFSAGFLLELLDRADAVAVCAQISEVDPGEECWAFADWVFVVGTIPQHELADTLAPLQPNDVGLPKFAVPEAIRRCDAPVLVARWD